MGAADPSGASERVPAFDFSQVLGIADALPILLCFVDRQERYRFCNRTFAEFMNRSRGEILGRTVREVIGEDAYLARRPMLAEALAGERQWFAAQYDHPTRGPLALQTEYLPQKDPATGAVTGVVIMVQDSTEQRIAERALRESEARFRRIADSAPVMMWVTRLDRRREFVNEAYLQFTGLTREEVARHEWRDFVHPDDWDRVVSESMAGEASRQPFSLEARYRRHDGEWRWLLSVSRPRFGPDGELIGFIGAAFDFTLAKQAELDLKALVRSQTAELTESEQRFRSIFDAVFEVLVLLSPDGTVLEVNRQAAPWREANPERAIGRKLWDAPTMQAYPEHIGLLKEAVMAAAAGGTYTAEVKLERPGVPTAYLDVSVQPVRGADGEVLHLLFEARDITELKGTQEQLRQSQKMEALGQLTGGIAHDFNNLLTVVVGGLDLIAKREADPKLKRYARNALEAAERGARLTAQLLAFSRVQRLEVQPTYVAPLIENMRALLRNVLGPGISKEFDLDQELRPVLADPTQLELAVLNLAINARDAMPDGGTLTVRTARVAVRDDPELEDGDYTELSIGDTGTGMPPHVVERAFEPFFTTKEVGKGTGLGLSMVYGVARQSGGTARISSQPGEGSCIKLYFRHAPDGARVRAPGEGRQSMARPPVGGSVLVIDDDPDVREFVAVTLEDLGYEVRAACEGAEGLAAFAHEAPDLVIVDFLMPGLSGADVAREIRAARPDQPILFVSGYNETDAIRQAAPDAALLAKPFRAEALDEAVRTALEQNH
jgi:PAS domain S-box-containing protein